MTLYSELMLFFWMLNYALFYDMIVEASCFFVWWGGAGGIMVTWQQVELLTFL